MFICFYVVVIMAGYGFYPYLDIIYLYVDIIRKYTYIVFVIISTYICENIPIWRR